MKTVLRTRVTEADLAELGEIYRRLQNLGIGMHPAAECYPSLYAATCTVRWVAKEWSGRENIFNERDSIQCHPERLLNDKNPVTP